MVNANVINGVINNLAAKLSVPASQIFHALIMQARINGFCDLMFIVALIIILIACCLCVVTYFTDRHEIEGLVVIGIIGGIVAIIMICMLTYDSLTSFYNPHYWAITKIMSLLTSGH